MSGIKLSNVRKFAISGAAAVAVALPLAMVSAPAQAATTLNGCTVDPLRPVVVGQVGGVPQVRFSTRVTCSKDRIVQIRDQRREADAPAGIAGDDSYGSTTYLRTFDVTADHRGLDAGPRDEHGEHQRGCLPPDELPGRHHRWGLGLDQLREQPTAVGQQLSHRRNPSASRSSDRLADWRLR